MNKNIAVIKGDGIGPEIVTEAIKVLNKIGGKFGHTFNYTDVLLGGCAIDQTGVPLTTGTIDVCLKSDRFFSVQLVALSGIRVPETFVRRLTFRIRGALKLFANIRPAKLFLLQALALLKMKLSETDSTLLSFVNLSAAHTSEREALLLTKMAVLRPMAYSDYEVERICRVAFEMARKRRSKVHSIDKATFSTFTLEKLSLKAAAEYPDVEFSDMLVDNTAMQLVRNPSQFDVMVTENLFGDILSDEASMITGSLGMIPSASLGEGTLGLYEPIHGSAPDIAGQNKANPIATILSVAMMLRFSFDMGKEADAIENAVNTILDKGYRTDDIMSEGMTLVSCSEIGDLVAAEI